MYAYALEKDYPEQARSARGAVRGFGEIANKLGDEATLDFRSETDHRRLKANLAEWSRAVHSLDMNPLPSPELDRAASKIFQDYFR